MLNLFSKFNCRMTSQLIALNLKHMVLLAYLDTLKSGKAVHTIVLKGSWCFHNMEYILYQAPLYLYCREWI